MRIESIFPIGASLPPPPLLILQFYNYPFLKREKASSALSLSANGSALGIIDLILFIVGKRLLFGWNGGTPHKMARKLIREVRRKVGVDGG